MSEAYERSVIVAINALWHREHTLTWAAHHAYQLGETIHIVGCLTRAEYQHQLPRLKATLLRDIAHIRSQQPDLQITHSFLTQVTAENLVNLATQCNARSLILAPALTMQPESVTLIEDTAHNAPCKVIILPNTMRAQAHWPVVAAVNEPEDVCDAVTIACRYAETRDIPVTVVTPSPGLRRPLPWWKRLLASAPESPPVTETTVPGLDRARSLHPRVQLHHHGQDDPAATCLGTALRLPSSLLVTTLALAQEEAKLHHYHAQPRRGAAEVTPDLTDDECIVVAPLGFLVASGRPTVLVPRAERGSPTHRAVSPLSSVYRGSAHQAAI